jgi:hypothetical protein
MTDAGIDALNKALDEIHNEDVRRWENGLCAGCGASFLAGGEKAEIQDDTRVFRLCFWCFENEDYDPSDPQPSKFNYGNC